MTEFKFKSGDRVDWINKDAEGQPVIAFNLIIEKPYRVEEYRYYSIVKDENFTKQLPNQQNLMGVGEEWLRLHEEPKPQGCICPTAKLMIRGCDFDRTGICRSA